MQGSTVQVLFALFLDGKERVEWNDFEVPPLVHFKAL